MLDHDLFINIAKIHTTQLGIVRIAKNLGLDCNVVECCKAKIINPEAKITRAGKNWYIQVKDCEITVNAHSYTIITAHKLKKY